MSGSITIRQIRYSNGEKANKSTRITLGKSIKDFLGNRGYISRINVR